MIDNQEFIDALDNLRNQQDAEIDLVKPALALALALLTAPDIRLERYYYHCKKLCREVKERFDALIDEGAEDDATTRLAALKHILADKYEYRGDRDYYDNLQNANLAHVIDRRKGMPIALSILYIAAARAQGWHVEALNFPAHVVCRIEHKGERFLFDPFERCKILQAADLRIYLKTLINSQAELSAAYYEASTNREVLIRLQNNIKLRQIEAEDYAGAVHTVEAMRKIDPTEFRLLFDAGVLYARLDQPMVAMRCLENYIDQATEPKDRQEALHLLSQIRAMLN